MADAPAATLFKAYDVRGIAGSDLTGDAVTAIARAFASEALSLGFSRIALGRDGRLSSPDFHRAAIHGLRMAGVDVIDVGLVPTPLLYFAATEQVQGCGVMVTGSHNPPDHNGLKFMLGGETLAGARVAGLRDRILEGTLATGAGSYRQQSVEGAYLARLKAAVRLKRPLRVVVDCGNGAVGTIAQRLLEQLGCPVETLFSEVDGRFPHHHPDPSHPENLLHLHAAVASGRAELGLAFDGDGDRLGVIIPGGDIIWPDRLLILFARDVLQRHPGAEVIYDIKCSGNLHLEVEARGGRPVMCRAGHSMIKARMRETGALLGGELTGHFFFAERWYGFDDALYAAAHLLEILSAFPEPPGEVLRALPQALTTPELRVALPQIAAKDLVRRALARASELGGRITDLDGLRVDYPDGWGLVRASNTTEDLVFRFEGDSEAALLRVETHFRSLLLDLEPSLAIPF